MSIYATMWTIGVESGRERYTCASPRGLHTSDGIDELVEVYAEGVPADIDDSGPGWDEWLPPPVTPNEGSSNLRAVFICGPWTDKGTARNGQEMTHPLLVLTGEEYATLPFGALLVRIEEALERAAVDGDDEENERQFRTAQQWIEEHADS